LPTALGEAGVLVANTFMMTVIMAKVAMAIPMAASMAIAMRLAAVVRRSLIVNPSII
jgi:hypothetical protein